MPTQTFFWGGECLRQPEGPPLFLPTCFLPFGLCQRPLPRGCRALPAAPPVPKATLVPTPNGGARRLETPEQPSRAQRAAQGAGALCSKGMGRGWGKLGTCPGPSGCPQPGAGGAVGPGWSGARLRPRLLTHSAAEHPWKAAAPPRCLAAGCQGTLGASTCGDRAGDKAPQKGWWRGGEGAQPRGARSRRLQRFAAAENGAGLGGERDGKVAPVPKEAAAPFSARFPMELEGGRAHAGISSPSPSPGCHRGAGILEGARVPLAARRAFWPPAPGAAPSLSPS